MEPLNPSIAQVEGFYSSPLSPFQPGLQISISSPSTALAWIVYFTVQIIGYLPKHYFGFRKNSLSEVEG